MPRGRRLIFPDVALHLVQRGVNRQPCFFTEAHYEHYLQLLAVTAPQYGCSIHAYCLMTNHVHLLLTPHQHSACARVMKQVNQCYVQRLNKSAGRSGTLWEGRFHTSLVASDHYALACYRYIELNPVRAGIAAHPQDYRWSSYRSNADGRFDPILSEHSSYVALSGAAETRRCAYRSLFEMGLQDSTLEDIRKATRGGYPMGAQRRPRGRPPRPAKMAKMGYVPI